MAKMFLFFSSVAVDKSCFKLKSADAASNELIFLKRVSTGQINTTFFFPARGIPRLNCAKYGMRNYLWDDQVCHRRKRIRQ